MSFSAFDGGLILIIVLGAAVGWSAGIFLSTAYVGAALFGNWVAESYAGSMGFYIGGHMRLAYGIIFICVAGSLSAGAYFLNTLTALPVIRFVNKSAGALAGAAVGLIVVDISFFSFLAANSPAYKPMAAQSRLLPIVKKVVDKAIYEWPDHFAKHD